MYCVKRLIGKKTEKIYIFKKNILILPRVFQVFYNSLKTRLISAVEVTGAKCLT